MKEVKVSINPSSFPSRYIPQEEKDSDEHGLRIMQAIQYEWFKDSNSGCRFYDQWDKYHKERMYARGEQSIQKYKDEFATEGDLSYLNLDWTPVPIIPKFVDIIVNGMADRLFSVKAYAQDAMSAAKRNSYQDNLQGDMVSKDLLKQIESDFGVNAFNTDPKDLPKDDDELSLHMQLKYKPSIELAEEAAINTVLSENKFNDTKKRLAYDATVIGKAIGKHDYIPGEGIVVDYVDPADVVHSYTECPNFSDVFYWGEVKTVPITELRKINPDLTDDDLEDISKRSQAWYDHNRSYNFYQNSLFSNDTVTLLFVNYKTEKKYVWKKKTTEAGVEKVLEKDDTWNPPQEMQEEGGFEKLEKTIEVWYEGVMVMGTNYVLKWESADNMVRPESTSQRAMSSYVACAPRMYKGEVESHVRRMIPFGDLIQMTHLKLQQVIQRVVPDGVFIDADGINEVDLGNGQSYTPNDALKLYFQTGSVIGRSFTGDGEFNHAKIPIQELNKTSGQSKIGSLITSYNHYLNMLRDVTGLNEAVDASKPDPNSLVGLQKLAALNSNTATRHILNAVLSVTGNIAEGLSCRLSDVLEDEEERESFARKIGKYNVELLDDIKNLYLHDFAIFIEVSPDEEERNQLESNIQAALAKENIDVEDAIDIREIKNIKLANQLLKVKRRRKQERDQEMKLQEIEAQSQSNMQSQQMAAQISLQKTNAETEGKIKIAQAQAAFEIEKMNAEVGAKSALMQQEFDYNMKLKGIDVASTMDKEEKKEDRKDKRTKLQATQQSKMIDQRKSGAPAIDFESTEDSLDGFSLEEFAPR